MTDARSKTAVNDPVTKEMNLLRIKNQIVRMNFNNQSKYLLTWRQSQCVPLEIGQCTVAQRDMSCDSAVEIDEEVR